MWLCQLCHQWQTQDPLKSEVIDPEVLHGQQWEIVNYFYQFKNIEENSITSKILKKFVLLILKIRKEFSDCF